jgi:presenilin-like A22 family membrane protease
MKNEDLLTWIIILFSTACLAALCVIFGWYRNIIDAIIALSDANIRSAISKILTEYLIIGVVGWMLVGKPLVFIFKKIAKYTPWTSDDELWEQVDSRVDDAIRKKLGG